jgi:MFS family permease
VSARRLFLLLAPTAAILGLFLVWRHSAASYLGLEVTKNDIVRIAREQANAKGVNADGWDELVDLQPDNDLRHYLTISAEPAELLAINRIVPQVSYRCVLENTANAADSVRVTVSPAGRLISYRVPPTPDPPGARIANISEAQARQIAEQELQSRLGAERAGFVYAGVGRQRHEGTSSEIRQFTFRRQYGKELSIESTVDTSGAKVIGFKLTPRVAPERKKRFLELTTGFNTVRGVAIILSVIAIISYIMTRFIRRSREHEVPLKRVAIVAALVFVLFAFSSLMGRASQRITALEQAPAGPSPNAAMEIIMVLVVSVVMATLAGVTWGGCEADLREVYPEKVTSTDALLGGLFHSRAVRSSLLIGLALAGYALLLSGLEAFLRARLGVWNSIATGELMAFQTAHPGLVVAIFAFTSLPVLMGFLLATVSATHRLNQTQARPRNRQLLLALLVFVFFLITMAGNYTPPAWALLQALFTAAILLVPFFLGDLLAVIVANAVSAWAVLSASLIAQPSAMLHSSGWTGMAVLAAIIAAALLAAFRRRGAATEVEAARPQYARNIAERLMLTTEMDAARQAQLRVMPRRVPQVGGVLLAAKHSASAEIETDYYEFFPSATHLGVAVADARLPGLSSALCISMLKGLLLNYAARLTDPRDLADRVYRQLSSIFGDDLPVSFFFGRINRDADRATAAFAFATFGAAPHAILVRAGKATSLEGEEYVELAASSDAVVIYNARLAEMRDRDGAPLGDDAIRAELARANSSDPQKLVDALFDLAARHARGVEAQQSWTAVALAPKSAEVQS